MISILMNSSQGLTCHQLIVSEVMIMMRKFSMTLCCSNMKRIRSWRFCSISRRSILYYLIRASIVKSLIILINSNMIRTNSALQCCVSSNQTRWKSSNKWLNKKNFPMKSMSFVNVLVSNSYKRLKPHGLSVKRLWKILRMHCYKYQTISTFRHNWTTYWKSNPITWLFSSQWRRNKSHD